MICCRFRNCAGNDASPDLRVMQVPFDVVSGFFQLKTGKIETAQMFRAPTEDRHTTGIGWGARQASLGVRKDPTAPNGAPPL